MSVVWNELGPEPVSRGEWRALCAGRHNVMLQGPAPVTDRLVAALQPHLLPAVTRLMAQAPFSLPAEAGGTLVLQNVSDLDRDEQVTIVRWLDGAHDRVQIISTTVAPVFPLIESGRFDKGLYYRLNVMLLTVSALAAG